MTQTEFVIVGQGLAGTALAWQLHKRHRSFVILDREHSGCSRLAAGLITPVTGKRLARSWRWDELFPVAVAFYREIENITQTQFFHQRPALRIFANTEERDRYQQRYANTATAPPAINTDWFAAPLGGFELTDAARLDVATYLDCSRDFFRANGNYRTAELDLARDLQITPNAVTLPAFDLTATGAILCRGYDATRDPWFGGVPFNAAKGEFVTLHIPGLVEERVVHRGIWLAPMGNEVFRVGATYTWEPLNAIPTAEGLAELASRLREFVRLPYTVLEHRAAVRPVIDAGYPVLGRHPHSQSLAYFNGLGSKGSLLSPFFAHQLANHLCDGTNIENSLHVSRFIG